MECYGVSAADEASIINNPTILQSSASPYTPVKPMSHAMVYSTRWIFAYHLTSGSLRPIFFDFGPKNLIRFELGNLRIRM